MNAATQKALTMKIMELLPDDPRAAVASAAIAFACVVAATKCDEEQAVTAFRVAMRQMRGGREGPLNG